MSKVGSVGLNTTPSFTKLVHYRGRSQGLYSYNANHAATALL